MALRSENAPIVVRRVAARHRPARAYQPPTLAHLGRVVGSIDEVRPQGYRTRLRQLGQPARQAERALVEHDGAAMVVECRDALTVAGDHLHALETAVRLAGTAADQVGVCARF